MKLSNYLVLLAALGLGTAVHATAVPPHVTGTVQQVGGSTITVNGHTYQVTPNATSDAGVGSPRPGQQVTLALSKDGSTVIAIHAASPTTSTP